MSRTGMERRAFYIFVVLLLVAFGIGYAVAASLTITNGAGENGSGVYHASSTSPAWWSEFSAGASTVPSGLSTLSATAGTPTVLAAASASYAINTPTAGDIGFLWKLQETTAATVNTELELIFQLNTGGGAGTLTSVTSYVETQSSAPGSTLTFSVYFDLGAGSSGPIVQNVLVIWQQCASVGNCP